MDFNFSHSSIYDYNIIETISKYNLVTMSKSLFNIIMIKIIAFGILILIQYLLVKHFRKAVISNFNIKVIIKWNWSIYTIITII